MPAFRVTWTQPATLTATVTVELRDLAEWAIAADVVRMLGVDAMHPAGLTRSLERNEHLRDALLQLWAARKATT